jgi:hypothetical protein
LRRTLTKAFSLTLFGIVVAAVTAEIMARVMVAQGALPDRMAADIFAPHAIGWTLEPGIDVRVSATNGIIEIKTNSTGFRDKEYPRARQEGIARLLVLGDSYALALETPQDDTFHTLLENHYGGRAEVISMAASGYGPLQEYLAYQTIGRDFAPDVALVMFFVGNDMLDNDRWDHLPHYALAEDGTLALREFPYVGRFSLPLVAGQRSTWLMRQSMLAFMLGVVTRKEGRVRVDETNACGYVIAEDYPDPDDADWRLTEALLLALRDAVEADGAALRIAIIPTELQVQDAYMDDFRARCAVPDWAASPTYQQDRLIPFLEANEIAYLDLLPTLREGAQSAEMYFADADIHWTPEGHAVVARALYDWLAD